MRKLTFVLSLMLALVGLNANAAMYIVGSNPFGNWDPSKGLEMTQQADGTYSLDATLTEADIWFVFTEALGTWTDVNGNRYDPGTGSDLTITAGTVFHPVKGNTDKSFKFSGTVGEKYTFTFNPTTLEAKVDGYVEPITEFTYTVAGNSAAIFGGEWNTTLTDNDMTLDATDGLYKLVKNNVEIAGGFTLEYKVVQNHAWGTNWGVTPNGANQTYYFGESGTYNLTFMFDLENEVVSLEAEKIQDGPEVDPITGDLFILGQVNGNNWNPSTGIEMATVDEDVYTLTDATFTDSGDGYAWFSFTSKLGENADDWAFAAYRRGAMEDGTIVEDGVSTPLADWGTSYAFKVLPGTYDVEVGLSSDYVKLTLKETPQPVVDDVYIIGDVNNIGWSATQGVPMTYNEGIYTAQITTNNQGDLGVAYFGFTKKLADTESETPWDDIAAFRFGPVSDDAFVMTEELLGVDCDLATDGSYNSIAIPEGTWTVTVDLVNNKFAINGEWPIVEPVHYDGDVYILGEVNNNGGWFPNVGAQMNRDSENNVYTLTITTQGENEGYSYFSFTKKLAENDWENGGWDEIAGERFGAVSEGDFLVTDELLGQELAMTATGYNAYKIPAGTWNLTLSVDNMTLVIEKIMRGDVNMDGTVGIGDVTALVDYILTLDASSINLSAADSNQDGEVGIGDVTTLVDFILTQAW